jgi:nucleoside-diphosphate-sugar epimerase
MAIAAFVRRAMRKEPITVYGDGKQGRCWIYVTDLAQAHCLALKQEAKNQIMNLAGRDFVTISEIVELLSKSLSGFPVKHEAARPGDFAGVRTSIEKAEEVIHWSPQTQFIEGLSKYIAYVRGPQ